MIVSGELPGLRSMLNGLLFHVCHENVDIFCSLDCLCSLDSVSRVVERRTRIFALSMG